MSGRDDDAAFILAELGLPDDAFVARWTTLTEAQRRLVGPAGFERYRKLMGVRSPADPMRRFESEPGRPEPAPCLRAIPATTFVERIGVPEYVLDGVLQRGFLYSLTGPTGAGKTAVAVALAASVALGQRFAGREVEPGRVLYVASENPADVGVRVHAWAQVAGVEVGLLDDGLWFVGESFVLHERGPELFAVVEELAPSLVVLDTDAAIAGSEDENSNGERIAHAKRVRELTRASSRPCVLDLCHPTANATRASLRPRGGSAFLAEVDGNLGLWKDDGSDVVELFRHSKFRGPDFDTLAFTLRTVPVEAVKDSRGRPMLSVVAVPATAEDDAREWKGARDRLLAVLRDVSMAPDVSQRRRAESLGIPRATLQRTLEDLTRRGALRETLNGHEVTDKGKKWLVGAL